jgi:hypothetical protein
MRSCRNILEAEDYRRNEECECCWEANESHTPADYYHEELEMFICADCLDRTEYY